MRLAVITAIVLSAFCASAAARAGSGEHGQHKNEIAGFVGLTHEGRDNGFSLGLEYERLINERFGVGLLAEHTWGDFGFWVYAVPFTAHIDGWKFAVAPGIEKSHGHEEDLVRLSVGHEFDLGGSKTTPSLNIDFVDGERVYVLGVSVGFGF